MIFHLFSPPPFLFLILKSKINFKKKDRYKRNFYFYYYMHRYDTSHQLSTPMTSDKQHRLTDQQQSQQHVISKAPPYFTVTAPGNTTVDNLIKRQLLDTRQFVSINAASLLEPYQLVLGSQLTTNQSTHHSGNT